MRSPWIGMVPYLARVKRIPSRKLFRHLPSPRNPKNIPKTSGHIKISYFTTFLYTNSRSGGCPRGPGPRPPWSPRSRSQARGPRSRSQAPLLFSRRAIRTTFLNTFSLYPFDYGNDYGILRYTTVYYGKTVSCIFLGNLC